ncbi:helix-turn-helix domain-containing protein [Pantoea sp. X85]|uniref:helix-turn-helix domain-containing protein n=1 Tax=Pantoea sp. X85 TaxID=3037258 RepID=UPI002413354B|nr:helix-turn-helix domain-containing protein [Pantoea sp. X85]WFL67441.1 helix-turn-helix domain-containing protein [Pantoea sp. X85]
MKLEKLTLTRKEAAVILGISTATVSQWVKTGRLRAIKISDKENSRYLFTREDCIAALRHGQTDQLTSRNFSPTQSAEPSQTDVIRSNRNDAAKRLEEVLKQRSTNAKRRNSIG